MTRRKATLDATATWTLPTDVVVHVLTALAAVDSSVDAADACLPTLLALPGVRAAAVVQRVRTDVVVVGSAGYPCGVMAPGARLPLEAGLPVTEAVRTGRPVAQGAAPGWLAAPFGHGTGVPGALLVSLDVAPPQAPADLAAFGRLATGVGAALRRTLAAERYAGEAAQVRHLLSADDVSLTSLPTAVRRQPLHDGVSGDVLLCAQRADATWLLAADVCGAGLPAALVAASVRSAAHAALPAATGPAQLLAAIEAGVRPVVGPESFVTAVAVRWSGGQARVASAGHPVPLLLASFGAVPLAVEPAPPLALAGPSGGTAVEATWSVPRGSVLVLHTDGLTDRRTSDGVQMLDPVRLCAGISGSLLQDMADAVLAAADAVAPASDDVSLLLVRVGEQPDC